jgi:Lon protease-like protein
VGHRLLPLFPLPLVLFPGAYLPLHIFEPRYRQMLSDCQRGDERFGILFRVEDLPESEIASGQVGCIAEIDTTEMLPDGRSNVLVHGVSRFVFERFVATDAPYHVGEVTDFEDIPEPAATLVEPAERVRSLFQRVGRAARTLADDSDALPELPTDPAALSFAIAAVIDLDAPRRQQLLASQSPRERLAELASLFDSAVTPLEVRAAVHTRSKSNGQGPHGPHASP